jgi:transcriptional regulator with XRE-family HTH domain
MKKTREILALNVRGIRLDLGMTQPQLAKRAGLSKALVGFVEKMLYNPTMEALDKIANGLGVPTWILLHPHGRKLLEVPEREAVKTLVLRELAE